MAAAPFENRTGRPDLDDLGAMAADWIIRGVMETPLLEVTELEAVYARGKDDSGRPMDPLIMARHDSAKTMIRGSYYLSSDSVLFQASIMDVAGGRVLRSFDPVGAPIERAMDALEALRERIAAGLSPLVDREYLAGPVDPDLVPPPSLAAYREFVAGVKGSLGDGVDESEHLRRAAGLDSTFAAPLIQLALLALWNDECRVTDSIGAVLERRREALTAWTRLTIDNLRASCRGDIAESVRLLEQRHRAYPGSAFAGGIYATTGLLASNQLSAAREVLRGAREIVLRSDPELAKGWEGWYWSNMAATCHMPGGYAAELGVTERLARLLSLGVAGEPRSCARRAWPGARGDGPAGELGWSFRRLDGGTRVL